MTLRFLAICFVVGLSNLSFTQESDYFMVWTKVGVSGDALKKTDWKVELNSRFDDQGIATFFPEVGIDYKLTKWLKPSLEYRFITDRNRYGNYKAAHRLNFNAKFKEDFDRLSLGMRLRYQYAFDNRSSFDYDADFDQAIRFKPEIAYDINDFILTPEFSSEFFYNPMLGEEGRRFDKVRLALGASFDLNNNHDISFKYQIDKRFRAFDRGVRHVLSLSYNYNL
jgi:hypothetical protein